MSNEIHNLLIASRARIADPKRWVKGTLEKKGCYCAFGALRPKDNPETYLAAAHILEMAIPHTALLSAGTFRPLVRFNDHKSTTHDEVIRVYDAAIEATK